MNWHYIIQAAPRFFHAAKLTLELAAYGIALSLAVGLAAAVCMAYRLPVLDRLSRGYVELSRNTPLLIQLFFCITACPKSASKLTGSPAA